MRPVDTGEPIPMQVGRVHSWPDRFAGFFVGAGVALIVASGVGALADDPPPTPPPTTTTTTSTTTTTPGVRFRAPGGGCVETSPADAARVGAVDDPACERDEEGE